MNAPSTVAGSRRAAALAGISIAAGAANWIYSQGPAAWTIGMASWIAAIGFALAAFRSLDRPVANGIAARQAHWSTREAVILIVILVAAGALRTVNLSAFPGQLHNDEMRCGIEAQQFLYASPPPPFALGWAGLPNFGYFLLSLPLHLVSDPIVGLRLNSVVYGLLSIVGTYLLIRTVFDWRLAALTAASTATFAWHLHFSRTGFHYMQADAFIVWTVLTFVLAWQRRSLFSYAVAGVLLGLALQVYHSALVIVFVLLAWAVARMLSNRLESGEVARGVAATLITGLVTYLPLVSYFAGHPENFAERARAVYLFDAGNAGHIAGVVGSSDFWSIMRYQIVHTLGFFAGIGDTSGQYGGRSWLIDPFLRVPAAAGLVWAIARLRHAGEQLLIIWIGLTLFFGSVLTIDPPFSPRMTPIATLVPVFAAYFYWRIWGLRLPVRARQAVAAVAVLSFMLSAYWNYRAYFVDYARYKPAERRDTIARILNEPGGPRTVINTTRDAEEFAHQAYQFVAPDLIALNTAFSQEQIAAAARPALVVVSPENARLLQSSQLRCRPLDDNATACLLE